jgi:hypothetical protein
MSARAAAYRYDACRPGVRPYRVCVRENIGQEVAKRTFTLLAGLLLALYAAPSHAEMRSGDGINFDLRLPKGFCALWRINRNEKPHYDLQDRMQAQVNAVLMIAVRAGTKAREIAVVSSWVAIKDRILMINAYTDYKDATTFDTLLAHTKDTLITTLKATRKP